MKKYGFFFTAILIVATSLNHEVNAQQYKLRQVNAMMGMKSESTIYVKGMRKRTESEAVMGMGKNPTTIEQCDLQRTIKINDKKKLYFIEPFSKETEEVIDEDVKPVAKNKTVTAPPKEKTTPQKGGVITMWYNITDTGERKKMYGFNARHVWTNQKMKPSPDACTMKDSMIIKTDGWYIDFPQFNCPVKYRPAKTMTSPNEKPQPDCQDRYVSRRSGKGKLGFPLSETRTMIMGNGTSQTSEYVTSIETLELSTVKLDSMLFEIPPGYTETKNENELQDKFDMNDMMNQYKNMDKDPEKISGENKKKAGMIRIGVYEPKGDDQLPASALQQQMVSSLTGGKIEALAISSEEEARKQDCDYTLASNFIKIKQGGKVGGLLKAIKNADPNAASSFTIEATQTLVKLSDNTTVSEPQINGKYDGKINDAAGKALDDGCRLVLKALK
ncbi:MAG: hypothetical protein IPI68_03930 [Chitinophagaceae bacterium]|nr:hypothetical protein [Chitinophagaceae bacterium]